MCGIAGIWSASLATADKAAIITRMTDSLRHRGPDGGNIHIEGPVALGHRRLSIIAPESSANQPMHRGPLTIVYNGELYNYREQKELLEEKGVKFTTRSDTEVLLALYENEGESCFARLNGIFAALIYNSETGKLVVVRDQFGIKPLLYSKTAQGFIFASELKALLSSNLIDRKICRKGLALLLRTGSVPQPETMIEGVKSLLPGHYMVVERGNVEIKQYYRIHAASVAPHSQVEWQEMMHACLKKNIIAQLVSDVSLGAFLSGGVDSGLIAAIMKEHGGEVKTFSVGFEKSEISDQYDETSEAQKVAEYLQTQHETFTITDQKIAGLLPELVRGLDHPTIDGINSYFVSLVTSQHVRVALSGTGADEIFGGYAWFDDMHRFDKAGPFERVKNAVTGQDFVKYYRGLHGAFSQRDVYKLLPSFPLKIDSYLPDVMPESSVITRTSGLVMGSFLQNQLLPDIDAASMAHALEVRVPYLSPDVVELALAVPDKFKKGPLDASALDGSYAANGTKKILVDIARSYLPEGFDLRPKRGFGMPMSRWLQTVWADNVKYCLSPETVSKRGIFDTQVVADLYSHYKAGSVPWTQVWLLTAIEIWCDEVLSQGGA